MTNQWFIVTLNNGVEMPALGLGVCQSSSEDTTTSSRNGGRRTTRSAS
jgi:diketogulonate reductase-like aldo/keto reductase